MLVRNERKEFKWFRGDAREQPWSRDAHMRPPLQPKEKISKKFPSQYLGIKIFSNYLKTVESTVCTILPSFAGVCGLDCVVIPDGHYWSYLACLEGIDAELCMRTWPRHVFSILCVSEINWIFIFYLWEVEEELLNKVTDMHSKHNETLACSSLGPSVHCTNLRSF